MGCYFSKFSTARKVLPATSSPSARASIRPPATTSTSAVDGLYTCCGCTLRDDDDDFEAYSTAAIIDHRREHQTADTTFPLMPATICRLTPLRTMRGSRQRARIADHDRRSRRWPTC